MKKNVVVFTISSDLVFAVANLMQDIKRLSPTIADEIVIINDGIDSRDLSLLNSILPTRSIKYKIPVNNLSKFNKDTLKYFTIMAYAKFECLKLLDEYRNIIYLDPDMVIVDDLSELLDKCDTGVKFMPGGMKVSSQLHRNIDEYDMDAEGICGCIFVLQDHLANYKEKYNFCISNLNRYADKLRLAEQAIFDFMIQEFKLKYFKLERDIYSPHPTEVHLLKNAKILHAYGQPKFWNGLNNEQWNKNHKKWLQMGGINYKQKSFARKLKDKLLTYIN